jgi:hypothetical protein
MNRDDAGLRGALSVLVRSYVSDLRRWVAGLSTRYIVAIAIAFGGILAIFAACAIGITALFNLIEALYGVDGAYAIVGGGLLFIGLILLLLAWAMLRASIPPLPRPHRQVRSARRMMVGSQALRAVADSHEEDDPRVGPVPQAVVAGAAAVLIGWIAASRLWTRRRARKASKRDSSQ